MVENIIYKFPQTTEGTRFLESLISLLGGLPNVAISSNRLVITASQPKEAMPVTIFVQDDITFPEVQFGADKELHLEVGNLYINPKQPTRIKHQPLSKVLKHDALGQYFAIETPDETLYYLPIAELCNRLKGHVVRIDHTGINIPSALVPKYVWRTFIKKLAQSTNIYRYPTGQEWPFILPATKPEFARDITEFLVGREPKYELVYDTFSPLPTIQIDIETDLIRIEIERLFPQPYGISFPNVADYFRTVYIDHTWAGLNIRFDIRFKNEKPGGDWETGKWLVVEGGRLQ
jgi:hypothetical protein